MKALLILYFAYKVHPSVVSMLSIFLLGSYTSLVLQMVYVVQFKSLVTPEYSILYYNSIIAKFQWVSSSTTKYPKIQEAIRDGGWFAYYLLVKSKYRFRR